MSGKKKKMPNEKRPLLQMEEDDTPLKSIKNGKIWLQNDIVAELLKLANRKI